MLGIDLPHRLVLRALDDLHALAEAARSLPDVEARLTDTADLRLRPGMEGIAKIDAGSHSLVWIWSHSVIEWLRLTAWKFLP